MFDIFQGSIGKAILLKDNQEKYIKLEKIIEQLEQTDLIDVINEVSKFDKLISVILEQS